MGEATHMKFPQKPVSLPNDKDRNYGSLGIMGPSSWGPRICTVYPVSLTEEVCFITRPAQTNMESEKGPISTVVP